MYIAIQKFGISKICIKSLMLVKAIFILLLDIAGVSYHFILMYYFKYELTGL